AEYYVQHPGSILIDPQEQSDFYQKFLNNFFGPWNRDKPLYIADEVFWGLKRYESKEIYGENNLPLPPEWIEEMEQKSDTAGYPSVHLPAITVVQASMRVLPTHRPVFYDPSRPGEGFPFDYMQNTLVPAGTPILITHVSSNQEWALAETEFAAGWIRWNEAALVDQNFINSYQTDSLAGFTSDNISIFDENDNYLVSGRVGMSLPLISYDRETGISTAIMPARNARGYAEAFQIEVSQNYLLPMPFHPDEGNFSAILNSMMGQTYGWGGLYQNRDCSALLKDVFSGFGIFLPRNSRGQAEAGKNINLQGLSPSEKDNIIRTQGRPWLSILYMPGHVMLYIGQNPDTGQTAAYHSMWGLRTKQGFGETGRWIIGRTVITSLEPGREMSSLLRPQGLLSERIIRMVILTTDEK
ncbi:MAG: SH3 domain-containing protein, partial [Desulfovibrionales bacterium]|nr:SH3 domain-containing protein [Desulfovibrionales bacterium]